MSANGLTEPLTREDLDRFERLLLDRRRLLLEDFTAIEEADARDSSGEIASAATHPADLGSDCASSELSLGWRASASTEIQEVDDALDRIRDGTFGHCEACGKRIATSRLEAIPYAGLCLPCKIAQEL